MEDRKIVFVAFAIEDERMRDFLKGQSLLTSCPFEYIDLSVKDAYEADWKGKVQTRIRRSHGVLALISKNSIASSGQKWELECARAEKKPVLAIWAYRDDRTPAPGQHVRPWEWETIASFIDRL
jgi:hypothetical protein